MDFASLVTPFHLFFLLAERNVLPLFLPESKGDGWLEILLYMYIIIVFCLSCFCTYYES